MRFHLTSEQLAIQDAVRGTLEATWGPEQLRAHADSEDDFHATSWAALMKLGVGSLVVPEAQGGADLGLLEAALVSESVGGVVATGPVIGQMIAALALSLSNADAAATLLKGIVTGATVATLSLDGELVQSARAADVFLVRDATGGLCVIEKGKDVLVEPVQATDRSRKVSRVRFGADPGGWVLYEPGDPRVRRIMDAALVLIAADALGGDQRVTAMSIDYAKERRQFGQPIGRFQALKHQLAEMALEVEPSRALIWYAAYAWDSMLPDGSRVAAIAKAHVCDVFTRVSRAAITAHGGIGYTWEHGLHFWFRRAVYNSAWLGGPAEHRARAASMAGW